MVFKCDSMNNSKFIIIEYDVLTTDYLNNTDKILYGYIVALSQNEYGTCFATTEYLCNLVGLKERQLYYSISKLKKYNFISIYKEKINDKMTRSIKPTINQFIELRDKENKKISKNELVEYDWLNE